MRLHRRALWLPVVLLAIGCGDEAPRQPAGVTEGAVIVPPVDLPGQTLEGMELSAKPLLEDEETMAVTKIDGHVVRISERSVAAVEASCRCEADELGSPGPVVDGRPTRVDTTDLNQSAVLATVGDRHVTLISPTVSEENLASLVSEVDLPLTRASVPGDVVGVVRGDQPTRAARASYRTDDYTNEVTVFVATPEEQAAYLALLVDDPWPLRETVDSCCPSELLRRPRTVSVLGTEGTIGTVGSLRKLLVVPGDPGIVLVSKADRIDMDGAPDAAVVAVLEAAAICTARDLEGLVADLRQDELDQQLTELTFPEGTVPAEILTVSTPDGAEHRLFVLNMPLNEQIELTGDDLTAGMAQIDFVAYAADGSELGREPLFRHLQA